VEQIVYCCRVQNTERFVDLRCVSTEWHVSVIALLMFTLSFGLMAIVLSIGGLCSTSLPKKIYYYHSAGEIYVICGEFLPSRWRLCLKSVKYTCVNFVVL